MKDRKGIKEINERQYLERYRGRFAMDWFDISIPRLFPTISDLITIGESTRANLCKINLPINPGVYPRFICIDAFCTRYGIHDFSLHVPHVRTSIGGEGRGFRLVSSLPTRHRFSIVECGPGAVTNLMKLFSV